ncbi:hypothetical protein SODALDRAFT_334407 [Sodiomyces alkalinus F11]|uniref:Uncharacterized protein n=1 Tax=Sodiomyces alkalinus (strain CBS 110278 / VKM F-3762 / F11) TaxID=1314773 RepID=A0A3N2PS31_SODAK|nr:hypothetical protein SODALDRAFT_334407 [Sodiomyces alkalinus F11]ROT37317.1 hypothetical protein SODALDRAFT_334407 [Sodiomyces alkalinus F11]
MERTLTGRDATAARHALSMEQSLKELQDKIEEYKQELATLQREAKPCSPEFSTSKRAPFEVMKAAFESVSQEAPFMPSATSVLPALLALRKTHQTIVETRTYLGTQTTSIDKIKRQLEAEATSLKEQQLLTTSLENRIQRLKDNLNVQMEMEPEQVARERVNELKEKKKHYDRERIMLFKGLNKFIDDHLAAQLAAEVLGGPVVGDMMDIDSDDLAAGFTSHGRPKKAKKARGEDEGGLRQRRLEEVWGPAVVEPGPRGHPADETAAAGQELRELTEELLNRLVESGGDSSAAYVRLPKETAAARFLVRSKVAQFHPRDATRIKLIDFGKELDD